MSVLTGDITSVYFFIHFISNSRSSCELPVCTPSPFSHWVVFFLLICWGYLFTVDHNYLLCKHVSSVTSVGLTLGGPYGLIAHQVPLAQYSPGHENTGVAYQPCLQAQNLPTQGQTCVSCVSCTAGVASYPEPPR